jgi:hypothetical protein
MTILVDFGDLLEPFGDPKNPQFQDYWVRWNCIGFIFFFKLKH